MPSLASVQPVPRRLTPSRLALARRLRGLSQTALAKEVGVSQPAVNQFEAGSAQPSAETLERLVVALKVAPAFLARPDLPEGGRPFFRALTRVPAGERDRAHAFGIALGDVVAVLEEHLELPPLAVRPLLEAQPSTPMEEIERAAARARTLWGVVSGPVPNVVALAEAHGVVVAAVGDFHPGIDAFTVPGSPRPVVVLCSSKGVATRRRFDVGHELGHLVLHQQRDDEQRWQEQQAHRFASALLMPASEVADQLPRRGDDLRSLERVAKTWGVSMQAAMMRARDLGYLDASEHARGMRRLAAAGWRTKEPIAIGPPERPSMLRAAMGSLREAGTSVEAVADQLGLPLGRLERMMSLPEEHDDTHAGVIVQLHGSG